MKQLILSIAFVLIACCLAIAKLENNSSLVHVNETYSFPLAIGILEWPHSTVPKDPTWPFTVVCLPQINVLLQ